MYTHTQPHIHCDFNEQSDAYICTYISIFLYVCVWSSAYLAMKNELPLRFASHNLSRSYDIFIYIYVPKHKWKICISPL